MKQPALFPERKRPPNKYRLFAAIFPDPKALNLICQHQVQLRETFGLTGKPRPYDHLHVTLHHLHDSPELPEQAVATAINAFTQALANMPPVDVTFDHAMSFLGHNGNNPFVLVNPNGNPALLQFHRLLITGLLKHQLAIRKHFKFTPHLTLLYDKNLIPVQPIAPVSWTVNEVVLILSHLGLTKYERLACWKLAQ